MPVLLDSCVYLDLFTRDRQWFDWSSETLARVANVWSIIINPVIYAEISIRFERIEEIQSLLPEDIFEYRELPKEAAFLAGKCFLKYRKRGIQKISPLPDFFIGAHAAVLNIPLVTRDTNRFREYFPKLELICP